MKKPITIAGILTLSIIAITTISTATAAVTISTIAVSGPGTVWQFNPPDPNKEIDYVKAYWYVQGGPNQDMPDQRKTIITDGLVTLVFKVSDVKDIEAFGTAVEVFYVGGGSELVSGGAGFAWGRTR